MKGAEPAKETLEALAAYVKSLPNGPAPFLTRDGMPADNAPADVKRGFALFSGKAGCMTCHSPVAYDKKGFADRARDSFERAVKMTEDADTLNNLGFSLYQNGNYRAAVDRLKRAAKLAPTDERILNNLGLAYCRLGKIDEAYKAFARATGPLNGNLNTAKMLERFGREDDAIRYYEAARTIDPNNTLALRRLADLYQRVGRAMESEAAKSALALASNNGANNTGK